MSAADQVPVGRGLAYELPSGRWATGTVVESTSDVMRVAWDGEKAVGRFLPGDVPALVAEGRLRLRPAQEAAA